MEARPGAADGAAGARARRPAASAARSARRARPRRRGGGRADAARRRDGPRDRGQRRAGSWRRAADGHGVVGGAGGEPRGRRGRSWSRRPGSGRAPPTAACWSSCCSCGPSGVRACAGAAAAVAPAAERAAAPAADRLVAAAAERAPEDVAAVGVLVDVGRQVVAGVTQLRRRVVALEHAVVGAVGDDLLAGRRRRAPPGRRRAACSDQGQEEVRRIGGFTLAAPRAAPAAPARASCPSAQASWVYRGDCRAALRAQPRAQRRGRRAAGAWRRASAGASPAGTTSPLRSWRTRPPATAPTALVAITGTPWWKASLTTSPHGSRKSRVGIDGTTTTSLPA